MYRGSLTYTIGPGGDFDFGNNVTGLSGDTLVINFELDVQHAFIFEFPPGSERAVLEPKGGWQAWLDGGQPPGSSTVTCRSGYGQPAHSKPTSCASTTRQVRAVSVTTPAMKCL